MEYAIPMSEMRKRPGAFFDQVIRERPAVVTRHRDAIFALSESHFFELVKHLTLTLQIDQEDGIYAVDIPELELLAWGENLDQVKENLADQVISYTKDYLDRFHLFFHAPNRKDHFPYVLRVLLCENKQQVMELFRA
jgi:hypothetical protein